MSRRIDIAGEQFGRWTALRYVGGRRWLCRCECGAEKEIDSGSLRAGRSQGCIKCHTGQGTRRTHGGRGSRLYTIWRGMIDRCENPNSEAFDRYGARGISVCPEWRADFAAFREWALANGYADALTIDRMDNDRGYEPGNCRWATYAEQNRNYGRNRPVEFRGRTVLICDLAAEVGLPQDVLKNRILRYGWDVEKAVSTPVQHRVKREPWKDAGMSRSAWYRAGKPTP